MIYGTVFRGGSVFSPLKAGQGSSLPLIPTKKLVITSPFSYCRNQITFVALLYYFGFGILISSLSIIGFSILLKILIIFYLKLIEEKELKERFGELYIKYKESIPFLIPLPMIKRKKWLYNQNK